ncbi:hypothetical protein KA005_64540, partial [bacterium]|nr:hypothetical protein [bacterium]
MKKIFWAFSCLILFNFSISNVYAIGISPARWTVDMREYGSFDRSLSYNLIRPGTRYSSFNVYDLAGLNGTLTELKTQAGSSLPNGIEYFGDNSAIIDWESEGLALLGNITALVNVQAPDLSICTVEPGTHYMDHLVQYSGMLEPNSGIGAVTAVVSQISIWRNYAPRVYLQDALTIGQSASLNLQFEDKSTSWWSDNPDQQFFSYEIDWESDGIFDQNGTAGFDEEPIPHIKYPSLSAWSSGIQTSALLLDHIYDAPGNYIATINVTDLRINFRETTSLQIP